MKIGLSLAGMNDTINALQAVGISIEKDFTSELFDNAIKLRDKAKEILQGKVDPVYSTGKLADSIGVNVLDANRITVGPDMRVAPYAEWVEIGHYLVSGSFGMSRGSWWEGHHYMEGAWTEISPDIAKQIADTLSVKLNNYARSAGRTRHQTTGRFVAGWGGVS